MRKFLKENGLRTSEDAYEILDEKVKKLVLDAVERAKKNARTTVMEWDI